MYWTTPDGVHHCGIVWYTCTKQAQIGCIIVALFGIYVLNHRSDTSLWHCLVHMYKTTPDWVHHCGFVRYMWTEPQIGCIIKALFGTHVLDNPRLGASLWYCLVHMYWTTPDWVHHCGIVCVVPVASMYFLPLSSSRSCKTVKDQVQLTLQTLSWNTRVTIRGYATG